MNRSPEELLFGLALTKPAAERTAWLDRECAGDSALRQRVEALLAAHEQPDSVMATRPDEVRPTIQVDLADDLADAAVGLVIGRYKLLEKLGEGGCGVVYVAEQTEPVRRRVALKVIKLGMDTKQVVARFEAERQALAMMDHPNIAKVLDAGTIGEDDSRSADFPVGQRAAAGSDRKAGWKAGVTGRPYFVMELVRGIRITDYCDQNQLTTKERLELFIKVCQAIQHAHQKGIIHRDIKPSNILVTLHDGVPVPKVIDFGIAKATEGRLTDATVYTQLHQFIGTPAYMSPEQAEMSGLDIDTRSDIYSLGVLLYELLTGKTPFDGKELMASGLDAMRKTIREKEPPRPSTRLTQELVAAGVKRHKSSAAGETTSEEEVRASSRRLLQIKELVHLLRGDLDWIVMKCLEKDRARRYETANGLAADLKRHLNNEPVVARPPSTTYRLQKAWRRNKVVFASGAAVALALVVGLFAASWQAVRATRAERAERIQAEQARAAWAATRRAAYAAEISVAFQALAENNLGRAHELLDRQRPKAGEEDLRGFEWRYLWQLCQGEESVTFRGEGWEVITYSPDGKLIACAAGHVVVRDAASRKTVATLAIAANTLSFAPQARLLACGNQSLVTLWDTETWQRVRVLPGAIHPSLFSSDGHWLLTGVDGGFRVWDTQTWQPLGDCPGAPQYRWHSRNAVAFSPDSRFLVTIAGDSYPTGDHLRVWRLPGLERLPDLRSDGAEPSSAAFSADGKRLLSGLWDGRLIVWDFTTGKVIVIRKEHTSWVSALRLSAEGTTFATASADRTIILWNAATFEPVRRLRGHVGEVWGMDLSPDGREVMSSSVDGTTKQWSTEGRKTDGALGGVSRVAGFVAGGRSLVAVTSNTLCVWTPESGARLELPLTAGAPHLFTGHWGRPYDVMRSDPLMVLGRMDGTVEVWTLTTGARLGEWPAHVDAVSTMAFSADSRQLATASTNGEVKIWDFAARRELAQLETAGPPPYCVAFSPDGNILAVSGRSSRVFLWHWRTRREIDLKGNGSEVFSVAFSPDGRLLAVTTQASNEARVWDVSSATLVAALKGHVDGLTAVAFSPDGRTLATASGDRRIKLWNVATHQEVATFQTTAPLPTLRFSPDGRMLAVGDLSNIGRGIQVLRAPSFEEIAAAEAKEKTEWQTE